MRDLSRELDTFFAPLVGSEAAIADFQAGLSERLAPHAKAPDAFPRLQEAASSIIGLTVCEANGLPPDANGNALSEEWRAVWANGIQGARLTIGTLSPLADVYKKHVHKPQTPDAVEANIDRMLRHTYKNAFNEGEINLRNTLAMRTGKNPRNPLNAPFFMRELWRNGINEATLHPRAFRVSTHKETGQLDIQPRHSHITSDSERRCPATGALIKVEGESASALLTFMRSIGTVAAQDIYPHRFTIAGNEQ